MRDVLMRKEKDLLERIHTIKTIVRIVIFKDVLKYS